MSQPVVFDCMVFLQAAANQQSPSYACLALAEIDEVQLFVSEKIFEELQDVLSRPKTTRKFRQLTPERVEAFLEWIRSFATVVTVVSHVFEFPRDPKDEPYLNLAIAARALYLVSRDNDLLDLMSKEDEVSLSFREQFPWLRVIDVGQFLSSVGKET